jgi:hypothetical protein
VVCVVPIRLSRSVITGASSAHPVAPIAFSSCREPIASSAMRRQRNLVTEAAPLSVSLVKMLCDGDDRPAHHMQVRVPITGKKRESRVKDQTAAAPADPDRAPRAPTRLVQREPSDRVVAIGLRDRWLGDLYHHLRTLPWWAFLLGLAAVYLGLNFLFAVLYLLGEAAIANARPGAFSDAFFFSVETISTTGYGQMSPATLYGNIVMTVEAIFGLILLATSAGMVLARFSRPTARVMFSKVAVVGPYNGVPESLKTSN